MRAARGVLLLAALALVTGGCIRATIEPAKDQAKLGIVVDGVGKVDAKPDTLVVSMGVEVRRATPQAAFGEASKRGRAMVAAVKARGVKARDIRTDSLQVFARFGRRGAIIGYSASQFFTVKIRDLKRAGAVLGAGVKAAGSAARVHNMRLEVADPDRVRERARVEAVADARKKARVIAERAGVRLGEAISISEEDAGGFRSLNLDFGLARTPGVGFGNFAPAFPEIEAGTHEVQVRVRIRFALA